eukprot:scaffold226024_cov36-Tisochrysis_lutea.AAC.1
MSGQLRRTLRGLVSTIGRQRARRTGHRNSSQTPNAAWREVGRSRRATQVRQRQPPPSVVRLRHRPPRGKRASIVPRRA